MNKSWSRTLCFCASLFLLAGCMDSSEIRMVKSGHLGNCPSATIEEMVDGFLRNPSWASGKSADGQSFVNIEGDFTYSGKTVRGLLQFAVDSDAGSFKFNAFEINEVPQPDIMALGLLSKMCEEGNDGVVAKVSEALSWTASAKLAAVETCQDLGPLTELNNETVGYVSPRSENYIADIQITGSCGMGRAIYIVLTTSEDLGVSPFELVLEGTREGERYSWTCTTTGEARYVPEVCR